MPEMPFGKYEGEELEDIPTDYLEWLLENCNLFPDLEYAVQEELADRGG